MRKAFLALAACAIPVKVPEIPLFDRENFRQGIREPEPEPGFVLLDEEFHLTLAAAAGNPMLVDVLRQINERLDLLHPLTKDDIISERCGVRPLVVKTTAGNTDDVDWTSLSRKHAIETDRKRRVVTIFGGKLTDCLNVGEEVATAVEAPAVRSAQ